MEYLKLETTDSENLRSSSWIYGGITRICSEFASVPLRLEKKTKHGWQHAEGHKLQAFLLQPNPDVSQFQLMERWCMDLHLTGNAYWLHEDYGFTPLSRSDLEQAKYDESKLLHWQFPNPDNKKVGLSPIAALSRTLHSEQLAKDRADKDIRGARRTIPLSDKLNIQQMEKATATIRANWCVERDGPEPAIIAGTTGLIDSGKESALENLRFSREEIAAALGIPVSLLHLERISRDEAESAELLLWEAKLIPLLTMFCRGLEPFLLKKYGLKMGKWRIKPDLSEVRVLRQWEKEAELERISSEATKARSEAYERFLESGVAAKKAAKLAGVEYRPPIIRSIGGIVMWILAAYALGKYFGVI